MDRASGLGTGQSYGVAMAEGPIPSGVGVALVTIFGSDGRPDISATVRRAGACVEHGMTSVLLAGTTGEAWRLSAGERVELAAAVKLELPSVCVVVGTGDPKAARGLETTAHVAAAGVADALLVLSPGDLAAGTAALVDFYGEARKAAAGTPVLAYHNPPVSPPGIETSDVPLLGVDGIKDSSGSTNRLADLVEHGVNVYVGSPTMLAVAGACGAAGALLGLGNVAPELCIAAWDGNMAAQRALFGLHLQSVADFPGFLKSTEPGRL